MLMKDVQVTALVTQTVGRGENSVPHFSAFHPARVDR
jgi:hypothetical protein